MRYFVYAATLVLTAVFAGLAAAGMRWTLWPLPVFTVLAALGTLDLIQRRHNLRRNYPVTARIRWMIESIRPELRQYLFESDTDGKPFSREQRALVYRRAKNVNDAHPFGTEYDVYADGYEWISHSITPKPKCEDCFRIDVGGSQCGQPYSASVFNISAMSFGALSPNAIRALNRGAKLGEFAHDTGEGGLSDYHRENGGDLIWEIGSGYFGCRTEGGAFDPERFAETAHLPQVKMVEVKLSQGAKPGHGGVLPACKVSAEIARVRGVPLGRDCVSPAYHGAFSTPVELLQFVARLRELSGGKPAGFKLCVGDPVEFLAIVKAMLSTGILPDFIVVDGAEGGTGAAPLELSNHVGMPLREGLLLVHNALVGVDLRDKIRIGASGKVTNGFRLAANLALGADWCNAARGFMFALGCVQSQSCHTDRCPTGVATQDPVRQRAIDVPDKAQRVANFHRHTVAALAEIVAAAGLEHPQNLTPVHLYRRTGITEVKSAAQCYAFLRPCQLLDGSPCWLGPYWQAADPQRFGTA
ncbi:MAG: FMN-binding glutamate synthase family protein [Gammaproteobacteria bacterium]|nr:FMN-binding glutamate synthase family protein [Gammaproteobacteria bacterium]